MQRSFWFIGFYFPHSLDLKAYIYIHTDVIHIANIVQIQLSFMN